MNRVTSLALIISFSTINPSDHLPRSRTAIELQPRKPFDSPPPINHSYSRVGCDALLSAPVFQALSWLKIRGITDGGICGDMGDPFAAEDEANRNRANLQSNAPNLLIDNTP